MVTKIYNNNLKEAEAKTTKTANPTSEDTPKIFEPFDEVFFKSGI